MGVIRPCTAADGARALTQGHGSAESCMAALKRFVSFVYVLLLLILYNFVYRNLKLNKKNGRQRRRNGMKLERGTYSGEQALLSTNEMYQQIVVLCDVSL